MADQFDMAQQRDAEALNIAILNQQRGAERASRPAPSGFCLAALCGEEFEGEAAATRLFCGPQCARAFERQARK